MLRKPLNAAAAVFEPTAGAPDGTSASLPTPQDASALAPAPHEPLPVDASSAVSFVALLLAGLRTLSILRAFCEHSASINRSVVQSAAPKTLTPVISAFGESKASTAEVRLARQLAGLRSLIILRAFRVHQLFRRAERCSQDLSPCPFGIRRRQGEHSGGAFGVLLLAVA